MKAFLSSECVHLYFQICLAKSSVTSNETVPLYCPGKSPCTVPICDLCVQVFFEKVFLTRPFKALFVTSDDSIHEWRFRWQLDRMVSTLNMVCCNNTLFIQRLAPNILCETITSASVMQLCVHTFKRFCTQLNCVTIMHVLVAFTIGIDFCTQIKSHSLPPTHPPKKKEKRKVIIIITVVFFSMVCLLQP